MQTSPVSFPVDFKVPGHQIGEQVADQKAKVPAVQQNEKVRQGPKESADLAELKSSLADHNIALKFRTDDATHIVVVELIDERTGDPIQQFPNDVSLALAANFIKLQGQFVDDHK